jgi:hypothetical protein
MSASRYGPASKRYKRTSYNTATAARSRINRRMNPRALIKRTLMNMTEMKEVNCVTDYHDLKHNFVPSAAIAQKGTAIAGQDSRNLTFCLQGNEDNRREGNKIYGQNVDLNIVFNIPDNENKSGSAADGDGLQHPYDKTMCRIIVYEADHNTFKQMADTVESNVMTPLGLVADDCKALSYLNRKDFRIVSDDVIECREGAWQIVGSSSLEGGMWKNSTGTQNIYRKNIPINKTLDYVDAYTPTKQLGCFVVPFNNHNWTTNVAVGKYRMAWKFNFKDI